MIKGLRAQVRHEVGDVHFVKVPDERKVIPRTTAMSCATRTSGIRSGRPRFTFFIALRESDAKKWNTDPDVQLTVLHELAHAHMNTSVNRALARSHFLTEAGATIWGYMRFKHLAPKVTRRTVAKRMLTSWDYYTNEVGLGFNQLFALWYAWTLGRQIGDAINGSMPRWLLLVVVPISALFIAMASAQSHQRAKKRGLKSFRLQGVW